MKGSDGHNKDKDISPSVNYVDIREYLREMERFIDRKRRSREESLKQR